MNNNELMRQYANILDDKPVIKESIGSGIVDVVQARLDMTITMVEDEIMKIKAEAPEAVVELSELLDKLESASRFNSSISDLYWGAGTSDSPSDESFL